MSLALALFGVVACSFLIKRVCDVFEPAADHLGRNMSAGIKGATINAVASSMPELMTTFMMLFFYHDKDGFAAGVATCVGSSVFNVAIIPACCILAVRWSASRPSGVVTIQRGRVLVRDGLAFVLAMVVLLAVLQDAEVLTAASGLSLVSVYVVYMLWLIRDQKRATDDSAPEEIESESFELSTTPWWQAMLRLDFEALFIGGRTMTTAFAWMALLGALSGLGVVCYYLAVSVMLASDTLGIAPYFSALILAAAATSVPDTILSVKDALKGNDDDAISNALASNTFNITTCIGLPLLAYGWTLGESVPLSTGSAVTVFELCTLMCAVCFLILATLLSKPLRWNHALMLVVWYGLFIAGVVTGEMGLWSFS